MYLDLSDQVIIGQMVCIIEVHKVTAFNSTHFLRGGYSSFHVYGNTEIYIPIQIALNITMIVLPYILSNKGLIGKEK